MLKGENRRSASEEPVKKDIRTLLDLSINDFHRLFEIAFQLKGEYRRGVRTPVLAGRSLGMIFEKPSTRTRLSFETAMIQLGGTPIFISARDTQMARNEPVCDTARVMSRYLDALVIRTFSQELLEQFAELCSIPVINALTDAYHPCQVLSDLMTVIEKKGEYEKVKVAWVGDGNNVAQSWINAAAVLGFNLVLACPQGYFPDRVLLARAQEKNPAIRVLTRPEEAVAGADVIYTDVWASMGQEKDTQQRLEAFAGYQVNQRLVDLAAQSVIVMHCLPAHRGEEITDQVLEGPHSVVWDQSENKLHMHKAVLTYVMAT
jgi:ornithine carbamoyltransferase